MYIYIYMYESKFWFPKIGGYPHSWMVYHGKSIYQLMDDLEVALFQETSKWDEHAGSVLRSKFPFLFQTESRRVVGNHQQIYFLRSFSSIPCGLCHSVPWVNASFSLLTSILRSNRCIAM